MPARGHHKLPAVFMRGGTSKALVFHVRDLPADRAEWDAIFLAAMGSPDPNGRQLDGMGGGVTSLSKVCVVGPPTRDDADIDYSFFQVMPREARVATHGNCGNMSAAIGPFAVDEGLVPVRGNEAIVRIHNTNTKKIIRSTFALDGEGRAAVDGDLAIPGVAGTGSPVRLDFLDPGGAATGKLLPSGNVCDMLEVPGVGRVEVSMVDAANLAVFVAAADLGLKGTELPQALEDDTPALERARAVGVAAVLRLGLAPDAESARRKLPFVALVSAPSDAPTLSGDVIAAADADLVIRMLSNGQPHRALPATGAVCTAVAMGVEGSVVWRVGRGAGAAASGGPRRLAMPSGVLVLDAAVGVRDCQAYCESGTLFRTARRLFEGLVHF